MRQVGTIFALAVIACVALPGPADARDLFRSTITVGGESTVQATNILSEVAELFDNSSLSELFAGYTLTSPVTGDINLRGIDATLSYGATTALRLVIPSAGIDVTFDGANRNESQEQLEDWLTGGLDLAAAPQDLVDRVLKALVKHSPVEPVAGNPNSLESRMFEADFALGTMGPFLADFRGEGGADDIPNQLRIDAEFGHYSSGPFSGQTFELELSHGWHMTPRFSLLSDLALLYSRAEGEAKTGLGSVGLGVQARILDNWNLSLSGRAGVVGSADLGAAAILYSVAVVSHARFELHGFRLDLQNMIGVANSIDGIEVGKFELNYDLTNVALRNGLELSRPIPLGSGGRSLRGRVFWIDTHYLVDELFLSHTDEIGVGIGLADRSGARAYDPIYLDLA